MGPFISFVVQWGLRAREDRLGRLVFSSLSHTTKFLELSCVSARVCARFCFFYCFFSLVGQTFHRAVSGKQSPADPLKRATLHAMYMCPLVYELEVKAVVYV